MTQQLNTQIFAYAKQLSDNAFKAHAGCRTAVGRAGKAGPGDRRLHRSGG
jgi:hypothetical protein